MRSKDIQPRLLVIVYQGEEVPEEMAEAIVDNMVDNRIAPVKEMVQVKFYDANDISKLVGMNAVGTSMVVEHVDTEADPIIHSLVYIGERYKECKKDAAIFALRLSHDMTTEEYKRSTGKPWEEPLLTAVEILATKTVNLIKYAKYMEENGVTKHMLNVIANTYMYNRDKYVS